MGIKLTNIAPTNVKMSIPVDPPIADFTSNKTSGSTPLTINFTDTSANYPTSWLWDFKNDGTATSTQQNPTYTYTTPGNYTVKLTVTNSAGTNTIIKTNYITISDPPVANFTSDVTTGNFPLTVNFTDTSTNTPTSWSWDFKNDGTATSTQQNPSYTYTASGTYTVKLTATNAVGSNTVTKTDYINVIITAGSQTITSLGSTTFTVPAGVDKLSVVGVGGGGGGSPLSGTICGGGGGGSLSYANDIAVTPGESISMFVGSGGRATNVFLTSEGGYPTVVYKNENVFNTSISTFFVKYSLQASTTTGTNLDKSMERKAATITAGSPAVVRSTTVKKFGTESFSFPSGSSGFISIPNYRTLVFGSNNFTISAWVYPTTTNTIKVIACRYDPNGLTWGVTAGKIEFYLSIEANNSLYWQSQTNTSMTSSANVITTNQWNHVAVTRSGTTLRMFANGTQVATTTINGNMNYIPYLPVYIGRNDANTNKFVGYMDDITFVNPGALWTANYTSPTDYTNCGTALISAGAGGTPMYAGGGYGGVTSAGSGGNGGSGHVGANGGTGGGGAGGYTGNGGNGGPDSSNTVSNGVAGAGGGGGGGGGRSVWAGTNTNRFAGGGGVGVLGQGANGAAGYAFNSGTTISGYGTATTTGAAGGEGGSGGVNGMSLAGGGLSAPVAATYGGGGGGDSFSNGNAYAGGQGAVRFLWGTGKSYPSNAS